MTCMQTEQGPMWARWDEVMRSVARLMNDGKLDLALREVEFFLRGELSAELRASVLGMRAQLKSDLGDQEGAKADLVSAVGGGNADFTRYVNESSLAEIYRREKQPHDAEAWYRAALRTCIEGGFPGGAVLREYLTLRPAETLSEEERSLCIEAVQTSWKAVGLPGEPDVARLAESASIIVGRESGQSDNG